MRIKLRRRKAQEESGSASVDWSLLLVVDPESHGSVSAIVFADSWYSATSRGQVSNTCAMAKSLLPCCWTARQMVDDT